MAAEVGRPFRATGRRSSRHRGACLVSRGGLKRRPTARTVGGGNRVGWRLPRRVAAVRGWEWIAGASPRFAAFLALLRYAAGKLHIFAQLSRFRPLPEPKNHGAMTDPYGSIIAGYGSTIDPYGSAVGGYRSVTAA